MQNIILYTSLTAEARYSITVSVRFRNVLALRVPGEHRACLGARAQSVTQGFFAHNYLHTKLICYVCGYLSQLHGQLKEWRNGPNHPLLPNRLFKLIQISVRFTRWVERHLNGVAR